MSPVVFDTKNMEITNPKTWPKHWICYRNLITCRDNLNYEHYEEVETTCRMF